MQSKCLKSSRVTAVTLAVRPSRPRVGTVYEYELNGSQLRDVHVDGRWLTVQVTAPSAS